VPIGNLISQHLANFYLGRFDHWIKEIRKIKGYVRYMDDFLLFSHERRRLKLELEEIIRFLQNDLSLKLKENIQMNRTVLGRSFLGVSRISGSHSAPVPKSKTFLTKTERV
jgi:RNA-directed DNA polymerase